jgi:hypothetical protein
VCSTYFEILSHIEKIIIHNRNVLKFVISVGVAIVITCPRGHKLSYDTACTSSLYHKSLMEYPGISNIRRVGKNKDISYTTWYFVSLKVGHSVEDT